jgi:hypothetical protein
MNDDTVAETVRLRDCKGLFAGFQNLYASMLERVDII